MASYLKTMPASGQTVYLVDDDASVRRALTRLLRSAGYEVKAFASARDFLADLRPAGGAPVALVLDVRLPGLSGMDLQSELQTRDTILPIIFITGHGDVPTSVKAMKAGAVDFLSKPVKEAELLGAIEQALSRAAHDYAERLDRDEIKRRTANLTPREREVMALVARGLLNKQIAFELGTVEKTIKVHRARMMDKMQVSSLAELVRITERASLGKS